MEIEILEKFADQGVTVILLILFVWFFLTEFNKSQKEIIKMINKLFETQKQMMVQSGKQTELVEKLINKLDQIGS